MVHSLHIDNGLPNPLVNCLQLQPLLCGIKRVQVSSEFTVNSVFNSGIHLLVTHIQAGSVVNPSCLKVQIKCSKTDSFRSACDIYIGRGNASTCPIVTIGNYLHVHGSALRLKTAFHNSPVPKCSPFCTP